MFWTIVTCAYVALGLLAMYWVYADSKHPASQDEAHG